MFLFGIFKLPFTNEVLYYKTNIMSICITDNITEVECDS